MFFVQGFSQKIRKHINCKKGVKLEVNICSRNVHILNALRDKHRINIIFREFFLICLTMLSLMLQPPQCYHATDICQPYNGVSAFEPFEKSSPVKVPDEKQQFFGREKSGNESLQRAEEKEDVPNTKCSVEGREMWL